MTFDKVSSFYPDLKGLVDKGAGFERKVFGTAQSQGDGFTAIISTANPDRDGDVVLPQGLELDYYTGTLLFNHSLNQLPVGKVLDVARSGNGLTAKLVFAQDYAFARDVETLVRQDMLKGVSIGFIVKDEVVRGTKAFADLAKALGLGQDCVRIITKAELIEVSIVNVGANKDALIQAMASKSWTPAPETKSALGLDGVIVVPAAATTPSDAEPCQAPAEPKAEDKPEDKPAVTVEVEVTPIAVSVPEPEPVAAPAAAPEPAPVAEPAPEPAPVADPEPLYFNVIRRGPADTEAKALKLSRGQLV